MRCCVAAASQVRAGRGARELMGARKVFWLTVCGLLIGGADQYFQVHLGGPYGFQYWLGMAFAALVPVGAYFVGLAQPRVSASYNGPAEPDWERRYLAQKQLADDLKAAIRRPRASDLSTEPRKVVETDTPAARVEDAFFGRRKP